MTRAEILKIAKPMLFNTDMVRAILDNRKTVTRRLVKYTANDVYGMACVNGLWYEGYNPQNPPEKLVEWYVKSIAKSPYRPGDILYVRETWRHQPLKWSREGGYSDFVFQYRADFTDEENDCYGRRGGIAPQKWHPSIHMPREAARIFLRVTDVRMERLQDITEEQAISEGAIDNRSFIHSPENEYETLHSAREHFVTIWASTLKPADRALYGWDANPWVRVFKFEKMEAEK